MSTHSPLRILLADDHEPVRRGLRAILQPQFAVCGEAANGREAVDQARSVRPDVVLLDLKMPELNGLDAARAILRERPGTRVLLLTMHASHELRAEASRAGIEGVILKSDADTLAATLAQIERQIMHLAGATIRLARHIGAFFASDDERYRILRPFVAEGLSRGEKALHIVSGPAHAERLAGEGIAVDHDAFQLAAWHDMTLAGGCFDQDAMLGRLRGALAAAADAGFTSTRLVGYMEWALEERPGVADLAEFEARINDEVELASGVIVCTYELPRFNASVIMDVLRAHPAVVVGGALCDNPFYVPAAELRREFAARRGAGA
jgi:DNA-binding NarL/FixJ family response regulator